MKTRPTPLWVFVVFAVVLPLLGAYGVAVALDQTWLTPTCTARCEARGASLTFVTPGHKSGTPPAGCLCSDGVTEPWSGPTVVGLAEMAAYLGLAVALMAMWSAATERKPTETPD